jgi:hypothetical protein
MNDPITRSSSAGGTRDETVPAERVDGSRERKRYGRKKLELRDGSRRSTSVDEVVELDVEDVMSLDEEDDSDAEEQSTPKRRKIPKWPCDIKASIVPTSYTR